MRKYKIFASLIAVMLLLTTTVCYGSQILSVKDSQVEITFPDGWEVTDGVDIDNEEELDTPVYLGDYICAAEKETDGQQLSLIAGYMYMGYSLDGDDTPDTYTAEELRQYDAENGAVLLSEVFYDDDYAKSKESVFEGTRAYMRIPLASDEQEKLVYYAPRGTGVTVFVLTSDTAITKAQRKEVEGIIDSLSDEDYYSEFIALSESEYDDEYYEDYDETGGSFDFGFLVPIIIMAGVAIWTALGKSKKEDKSVKDVVSSSINDVKEKLEIGQEKMGTREKSIEVPIKEKEWGKKEIPVRTAFTGREKVVTGGNTGYLASLKTLLDSGVVTKEEYNEIIAKYEQRQRGK